MKKVRCFLAIVALAATLGGFSLQGIGASSLANAVASQHASSPVSASQSAKPVALKIYGPCPGSVTMDC